jgi:hypothetical protein
METSITMMAITMAICIMTIIVTPFRGVINKRSKISLLAVVDSMSSLWIYNIRLSLITSLILATLVIPFLWESCVSVFAQNNDNTSAIPFLPPSSIDNTISAEKSATSTNDTSIQNKTEQKPSEGTLTIRQVIVGTDQLLSNSKFKITPNPFTLKGSLVIYDNNVTMDSDPNNGVVILRDIRFSPYVINETSSPGFGPVLLKTRITVHKTNPDPIVTIENRQLNIPFTGSATVTAPYLNDSSFRIFVSNGAKVAGGTITLNRVDQLPSGELVSSEKQKLISNINGSLALKPVTFNSSVSATASALQLYDLFKIPTYPAPVKDIASNITYISPAFIVKQQGIGNATITLTPIVAKVFPNMTILLNNNSFVPSGLAKVENLKMKFAQEANNAGFSFGISNNMPSSFAMPKIPVDTVALFMNIGYIGEGGKTAAKIVNFSNSKSFASSPDVNIVVSKSLDTAKLADGCPDIKLYSFDESATKWAQLDKPLRITALDVNGECGYTLHTQHFSKFAVGGVKQQASSSIISEQ